MNILNNLPIETATMTESGVNIIYKRICSICNKEFETNRNYQNICSWSCRQERTRRTARRLARIRRYNRKYEPCIICGWDLTTDLHHDGKKTYQLCPNHHALITRGIKSIEELLNEK